VFAALVLVTCAAHAQDDGRAPRRWTFEAFGGDALNADSNLRIQQTSQPELDFTADWTTGGTGSPYAGGRIGWGRGDRMTEWEHLHHKILLTNNPPEVQDFQISDGLIFEMINVAEERDGWIFRYGGGVVVAHPESTVRGQRLTRSGGFFDTGQRLSGAVAQYAVERRFYVADDWFLAAETKGTVCYVDVPVMGGRAQTWNFALHGLLGFGYQWED